MELNVIIKLVLLHDGRRVVLLKLVPLEFKVLILLLNEQDLRLHFVLLVFRLEQVLHRVIQKLELLFYYLKFDLRELFGLRKFRVLVTKIFFLNVGGSELFSKVSSELLRFCRERTERISVRNELETLMDALRHSFLHLIEVFLHVLDNVTALLILLLQGKKLPLELISLVGCVL